MFECDPKEFLPPSQGGIALKECDIDYFLEDLESPGYKLRREVVYKKAQPPINWKEVTMLYGEGELDSSIYIIQEKDRCLILYELYN